MHTIAKPRLLEPGTPDYEAATRPFNTTVVQRPAAVAVPQDTEEVVALVEYARDRGLRVAPQRTGHNAGPLGSLHDTLLLRTDALGGVEIDPVRRIARVGAGARWADVVPAASALGLAALHGSTPDVSVAGYALGGGIGWYARRHGLAANSVRGVELVTADGELRWVDDVRDPDLFWALRGGGGNFGVVTALEVELFPIPEVYAGVLFFPWERAPEVLHAWHEWADTAPEDVTSVGRILQLPPAPHLPPSLRGRRFAAVDAVVIGYERSGRATIQPLRRLGAEIDTFAMRPPAGIAELHMDPRQPLPGVTDSLMLDGLDAPGIDRFLEVVGPGSGSELVVADLRQLGGALRRRQSHHGALSTIDAGHIAFGVGKAFDEGAARESAERLAALAAALSPYDTGRRYANFAERPTDASRFYATEAYRRLRAVKAAADPDGVFRANHPIPPAA